MNEGPQIELFMFTFNQEFNSNKIKNFNKQIETFENDHGKLVTRVIYTTEFEDPEPTPTPTPTPTPKPHVQWAIDLGNQYFFEDIPEFPLDVQILRKEEFGAIMYDPLQDKLFKLNDEGFNIINEMVTKYRENKKVQFDDKSDAKITKFISDLKHFNLWK